MPTTRTMHWGAKAALRAITAVAALVVPLIVSAAPAHADCTALPGVTFGQCDGQGGSGGDDAEQQPSEDGGTAGSQPAEPQPAESQPADTQPAGPDRDAAARLLELVNGERARAGLPPLAVRSEIVDIAGRHSQAMAEAGEIWHNDAYFTAETRARLGARALGENVARNSSADGAHARLMASDGHRRNILDARFTQVGIAAVRNEAGSLFVTQDFAAVPAPQPPPGPAAVAAPARGTGAQAEPPGRVAPGGDVRLAVRTEPAGTSPALAVTPSPAGLVRPALRSTLGLTATTAAGPARASVALAAALCAMCVIGALGRRVGLRRDAAVL